MGERIALARGDEADVDRLGAEAPLSACGGEQADGGGDAAGLRHGIADIRPLPQFLEKGPAVFAAADGHDFQISRIADKALLQIADDAVADPEKDEQGREHGRQREHAAGGKRALVEIVP